jgi:hypothetical protein
MNHLEANHFTSIGIRYYTLKRKVYVRGTNQRLAVCSGLILVFLPMIETVLRPLLMEVRLLTSLTKARIEIVIFHRYHDNPNPLYRERGLWVSVCARNYHALLLTALRRVYHPVFPHCRGRRVLPSSTWARGLLLSNAWRS